MTPLRTDALAGAAGGLAGGTAMTVLITQVAPRVAPHSMLPSTPAPIRGVRWTERASGHRGALASGEEKGAGLAAHALFSAASGAMYALARTRLSPVAALPAPAAGVAFGLLVWAATFQAALPALGVMPPTTDHRLRRWPAPLLGHSLFGAVTALVSEKVQRRLTR
jgi:uncharacterized membrane protein YagU involved in acid resistance